MKSNVVGKVICVVFLLVMLASEGESMGTFIPGGKRGLDINKVRLLKKGYIHKGYIHRSDEGLTLETSAFLPFTVANLRFQPSC